MTTFEWTVVSLLTFFSIDHVVFWVMRARYRKEDKATLEHGVRVSNAVALLAKRFLEESAECEKAPGDQKK